MRSFAASAALVANTLSDLDRIFQLALLNVFIL